MNDCKAIIFDMDGVLFDTEGFYYHRREVFLASKGISIGHLPPSFFIGGNMKQVWHAILQEDYNKWDIKKLQEEYTFYKNSHPLPYKKLIFPDTKEVIKNFHAEGYKLALASSSTMNDILIALEETGLKIYFSAILSGEDFPESKPHPAIYEDAIRQLGINKDNIIVIEDSEKGISAGISAGLEVWAIEDKTFGMNQESANQLVDNLSQFFEQVAISQEI